jgi:hypothetical protein
MEAGSKYDTENGLCFVLESMLRQKHWILLLLLWLVVTRTSVTHKINLALEGLGKGESGQKFGVIMKVNLTVHKISLENLSLVDIP